MWKWVAISVLFVIMCGMAYMIDWRIGDLEKQLKARENEVAELNALLSSIESKSMYAVDTSEQHSPKIKSLEASVKMLFNEKNRIWESLTTSVKLLSAVGEPTPEGEPGNAPEDPGAAKHWRNTPLDDFIKSGKPKPNHDDYIPWDAP